MTEDISVSSPDAEMIAKFAENLMLVEEFETLAVLGVNLSVQTADPLVSLSFTGRINKTDDRLRYNVTMAPADALALVGSILATLEHFTGISPEQS